MAEAMAYRAPNVDLTDRVAIVTGANRGMGKETAHELARLGANVVLACRDHERGRAAAGDIAATARGKVCALPLDLSSFESIRAFAPAFMKQFSRLDILVHNAAASLPVREVSVDGFERHWATNVLGPHLLTTLLLPVLETTGHARIVSVSTVAAGGLDLTDTQYERRGYSAIGAYRASKQASRMLLWGLARRIGSKALTVNALNPGYVLTELTTNVRGPLKLLVRLTGFMAQSALDGADTAIWLAASPEVEGISGMFWDKRRAIRCKFRDPSAIGKVWELVENQIATTAPRSHTARLVHPTV